MLNRQEALEELQNLYPEYTDTIWTVYPLFKDSLKMSKAQEDKFDAWIGYWRSLALDQGKVFGRQELQQELKNLLNIQDGNKD